MTTFLDALHSGRTLLLDGAMGTELIRRGYLGPTWRANLDAAALVTAIHADYLAAGAEALLTNTILLNPSHLSDDDVAAAGLEAVRLARSVAGPHWTIGSLGPMATKGPNFPDRDAVLAAAAALDGVDALMLETCSDESAFAAADWIAERFPRLPVLVSFAFAPNEEAKAATLARLTSASRIAAVGVNCGRDQSPADVARSLLAFRLGTTLPLFAQPNGGSPSQTDAMSIEVWSAETAKMAEMRLAMIGGCCGTTPECIRVLRGKLSPRQR